MTTLWFGLVWSRFAKIVVACESVGFEEGGTHQVTEALGEPEVC